MNILVNSCDEYICVSMEYIARSGIAGSQNMFSFRKYCQDVFNVVVPPKVVVWRAQAPCWCLALSVFIVLLYFILFFIFKEAPPPMWALNSQPRRSKSHMLYQLNQPDALILFDPNTSLVR